MFAPVHCAGKMKTQEETTLKKTRIFAVLTALVMMFAHFALPVSAEGLEVLVSISDGNSDNGIELAWEKVTVGDCDDDGQLTINDALFSAHDKFFKGGAAAGYSSSPTEFGISLNRLWGVENGGSYSYYVNDGSPLSLSDPVEDGDRIYAYAFADLSAWSDMYTYFDRCQLDAEKGDEVTLTLSGAGYDEEWNPVTVPVEGARILIDGKDSGVITDAEGKASVTLTDAGEHIISAASDSAVLVPPVCVAQVEGGLPISTVCVIAGLLCCVSALVIGLNNKKKNNEE